MKQLYFSILFFLCLAQVSKSQIIGQQYFDGADTSSANSIIIEMDTSSQNAWQIGRPQKAIFDSAATLPYAIVTDTLNFYPANDTSRFIAKANVNAGNWGIFAFSWKQKIDFEQGLDGGFIEYSTDSGTTWISVFNNPYVYNIYGFGPTNLDTLPGGEVAFSGTDSTWKEVWLCFDLSFIAQNQWLDKMFLRFTMISDSVNNNREGWMIDNMISRITFIHSIKQVEQETYLDVFPNPASTIVNIRAQKVMDFHIIETMELVDHLGRIVEQWKNIPTKFWFDTRMYKDGQYFLKVKTNLKSEMIPLLIQK